VGRVADLPPQASDHQGHLLSFFPGAKIGLLGLNGSGKSTVLRIMAGVDNEYGGRGAARTQHQDRLPAAGAGARSEWTVRQEVESALGEVMQAQAKLRRVYAALCRPDDTPTFDALAAEQARLENIIAAAVLMPHTRWRSQRMH